MDYEEEFYRIKDIEKGCFLAESYNTTDINCIKRTLLGFFAEEDKDEISKLSIGEILSMKELGLDLESSYEPFPEDNIGKYIDDNTTLNIFPKIETN